MRRPGPQAACSNATSGGNHPQIRYLVSQGTIKPLCDLLASTDARFVLALGVAGDCEPL